MIWKTIKNTFLCLRYPFLYPRNRFTGKHHNCWKILDYIKENYQKAYASVYLHFYDTAEFGQTVNYRFLDQETNKYLRTEYNDDELKIIYGNKKFKLEKELCKLKVGSRIIYSGWSEGKELNLIIRVTDTESLKEDYQGYFNHVKLTIHSSLACILKILSWIENYALQFICFPTTYTELDALESGWRKAFGKELCEDLKKAIIEIGGYKALFNFKILQIKEKYGRLRIYYGGYSKEIEEVISKYSDLSWKTCISYGKPSTHISEGYISPYCDDCYPYKKEKD